MKPFNKKEVIKEIQKTMEKVIQERKLAIQALIVRTMKEEKRIKHSILVNKVLDKFDIRLTVNYEFNS